MSFRTLDFDASILNDGKCGAIESSIRSRLLALQNVVYNVTEQVKIRRMAEEPPSHDTLITMKTLLTEPVSHISALETLFKQWKDSNTTADSRYKLLLPKLEASFMKEVDKLHQFRELVKFTEKKLDSISYHSYSTFAQSANGENRARLAHFSDKEDADDMSELPLDQILTKEQQLFSNFGWQGNEEEHYLMNHAASNLSAANKGNGSNPLACTAFPPPPTTVGKGFYDEADDFSEKIKKAVSSSSSTTTGGSASPTTDDNSMRRFGLSDATAALSPSDKGFKINVAEDDFVEDDYAHGARGLLQPVPSDDDDDDAELRGLLSRGSESSASYLDGWQLSDVDKARQGEDGLQLYVSRERLKGMQRIRSQLSQAAHVFRDLANLINEQQDDLDLVESTMVNAKLSTGSAVDELRKTNVLKQKARRRNIIMIGVTVIVAAIILFVYSFQGGSTQPRAPIVHPIPNTQA